MANRAQILISAQEFTGCGLCANALILRISWANLFPTLAGAAAKVE
jgi:hypothetical protein